MEGQVSGDCPGVIVLLRKIGADKRHLGKIYGWSGMERYLRRQPDAARLLSARQRFTVWFFCRHTIGDTSKAEASNAAADVSEAKLIELLRGGIGISDNPVKVDGVSRWRSVSDIARHYQLGRVFIAGDTAHVMPSVGASPLQVMCRRTAVSARPLN